MFQSSPTILLIVLVFFVIRYAFKILKPMNDNTKINSVLTYYAEFDKAVSHQDRTKAFSEIAKRKPLSEDLVRSIYFRAPFYDDFYNDDKIRQAGLDLMNTLHRNEYAWRKNLNPYHTLLEFFYFPATLTSFIFNKPFEGLSGKTISFLAWLTSILGSVYSTELREALNAILGKF